MQSCKFKSFVATSPGIAPEKRGLALVDGNDLPPQLRVGSGRHGVWTSEMLVCLIDYVLLIVCDVVRLKPLD